MDIVLKGFSANAIGVGDGVELFPLSDVGRIFGHGFSNRGFPAEELVARASGSAVESGRCGAGQQIAVNLIGKNLFILHAVGVGHGVGGFGFGFALDREGNGGIDSPLTLYVLQRKSLGVVTGQGVLAIVQVVPPHISVSSDGNVAGVAVSFVAGNIADGVCSISQREVCGGVRLGLRGADHFHGRFQLGQIFSTGLCGRADNREGHGGIRHRPPYIIVRIPG